MSTFDDDRARLAAKDKEQHEFNAAKRDLAKLGPDAAKQFGDTLKQLHKSEKAGIDAGSSVNSRKDFQGVRDLFNGNQKGVRGIVGQFQLTAGGIAKVTGGGNNWHVHVDQPVIPFVPAQGATPPGAIVLWPYSLTDATHPIPTGWALCDGTANATGSGFDLRGLFVPCASAAASSTFEAEKYALGDTGGFNHHGKDYTGDSNNHSNHPLEHTHAQAHDTHVHVQTHDEHKHNFSVNAVSICEGGNPAVSGFWFTTANSGPSETTGSATWDSGVYGPNTGAAAWDGSAPSTGAAVWTTDPGYNVHTLTSNVPKFMALFYIEKLP